MLFSEQMQDEVYMKALSELVVEERVRRAVYRENLPVFDFAVACLEYVLTWCDDILPLPGLERLYHLLTQCKIRVEQGKVTLALPQPRQSPLYSPTADSSAA